MKPLLLLPLVTLLLCGCPNTKIPKTPPQLPQPKASLQEPMTPGARVALAESQRQSMSALPQALPLWFAQGEA